MSAAVSSPKGAERRASIRYSCDPESFSPDNQCRPITEAQRDFWSATVRDLSTGGIGLVVNRRFESGTLLTVTLEDAERTARSSFLVRVMRVSQESTTTWLHGCAFPHQLSEAELLSLM
jgi:hypothetical protein